MSSNADTSPEIGKKARRPKASVVSQVQHLRLEKRSVSVRHRTHVARRCEISGPLYQRLSRLRPALATSAMLLHSTCATSCTANVPTPSLQPPPAMSPYGMPRRDSARHT